MEKEYIIEKMELLFMKVILLKANLKEKENILVMMVVTILVNIKMVINMVKELNIIKMVL